MYLFDCSLKGVKFVDSCHRRRTSAPDRSGRSCLSYQHSDQSYLWDVSVHGLCPGRVQCRERRNADPRASVSHTSQAKHSALRPTGETRWQLPYYRPSGFATHNRLMDNDYFLQILLDCPDPRFGILEDSAPSIVRIYTSAEARRDSSYEVLHVSEAGTD